MRNVKRNNILWCGSAVEIFMDFVRENSNRDEIITEDFVRIVKLADTPDKEINMSAKFVKVVI